MSAASFSPWSPFCCAVTVQDRWKGCGVLCEYEGLTCPSRLHRPCKRGERQQQREGRGCSGGSVSVDSGYGPAWSCCPAGSPCGCTGRKGPGISQRRPEGSPFC